MALLTQAQILAADRRKTRDITVPEWGGEVRLQEMSGDERDAWEAATFRQVPQGQTQLNRLQVRSRPPLRCPIGGDGRRLLAAHEIAPPCSPPPSRRPAPAGLRPGGRRACAEHRGH